MKMVEWLRRTKQFLRAPYVMPNTIWKAIKVFWDKACCKDGGKICLTSRATINSNKEQISVTANMNFEFNTNIKHLPYVQELHWRRMMKMVEWLSRTKQCLRAPYVMPDTVWRAIKVIWDKVCCKHGGKMSNTKSNKQQSTINSNQE